MSVSTRLRRLARHGIKAQLIAGRFPSRTFRKHEVTGGETPVLMCLWNRPSRLENVLRMLDEQVETSGVHLYLWNNRRSDHAFYSDVLRHYHGAGAVAAVSLVKSPHNLGSIGRFYWARRIWARRGETPIVVIDDDEDFESTFIRDSLAAYDPDVAKGWWAWQIGRHYWERTRAVVGGQVDHIGPGGSIFSSAILADPAFFTDIPEEFRFLDDIWFSWWVPHTGRSLGVLPVEMSFVMEETNQYLGQSDIKVRFFEELHTDRPV